MEAFRGVRTDPGGGSGKTLPLDPPLTSYAALRLQNLSLHYSNNSIKYWPSLHFPGCFKDTSPFFLHTKYIIIHSVLYVSPSEPHTGAYSRVHRLAHVHSFLPVFLFFTHFPKGWHGGSQTNSSEKKKLQKLSFSVNGNRTLFFLMWTWPLKLFKLLVTTYNILRDYTILRQYHKFNSQALSTKFSSNLTRSNCFYSGIQREFNNLPKKNWVKIS